MRPRLFIAAALLFGTLGPKSAIAHGDILVRRDGHRLATGLFDFDAGIVPDVRVFSATLDAQHRFTTDPGFVSIPDSLPADLELSLFVRGLRSWDGNDLLRFSAPPHDASLSVSLGPLATTVDRARQFTPSFSFATTDQHGTIHQHLTYLLSTSAPAGIYLLELQLAAPESDLDPSAPFWMVMNFGAALTAHREAIAWTQAALPETPPPGDSNGDGQVDLADLNAVRNAFGAAAEDLLGDVTHDDRVDLADLNAVRNHFGDRAAAIVPVPEPSASVLASGCVALAVLTRRLAPPAALALRFLSSFLPT